jgi:hypothetical protein
MERQDIRKKARGTKNVSSSYISLRNIWISTFSVGQHCKEIVYLLRRSFKKNKVQHGWSDFGVHWWNGRHCRYVANIVIGTLSAEHSGEVFVLVSEVLHRANHSTVAIVFVNAMGLTDDVSFRVKTADCCCTQRWLLWHFLLAPCIEEQRKFK